MVMSVDSLVISSVSRLVVQSVRLLVGASVSRCFGQRSNLQTHMHKSFLALTAIDWISSKEMPTKERETRKKVEQKRKKEK